jgi:hypothetical protein
MIRTVKPASERSGSHSYVMLAPLRTIPRTRAMAVYWISVKVRTRPSRPGMMTVADRTELPVDDEAADDVPGVHLSPELRERGDAADEMK